MDSLCNICGHAHATGECVANAPSAKDSLPSDTNVDAAMDDAFDKVTTDLDGETTDDTASDEAAVESVEDLGASRVADYAADLVRSRLASSITGDTAKERAASFKEFMNDYMADAAELDSDGDEKQHREALREAMKAARESKGLDAFEMAEQHAWEKQLGDKEGAQTTIDAFKTQLETDEFTSFEDAMDAWGKILKRAKTDKDLESGLSASGLGADMMNVINAHFEKKAEADKGEGLSFDDSDIDKMFG